MFAGGRIELVQSIDVDRRSAAPRRPDHICLLCADFDARIARVRDEGGIVTRDIVPSEAFAMRRMCFVLYDGVGLVELVEQ
jgi:hypothetical protein